MKKNGAPPARQGGKRGKWHVPQACAGKKQGFEVFSNVLFIFSVYFKKGKYYNFQNRNLEVIVGGNFVMQDRPSEGISKADLPFVFLLFFFGSRKRHKSFQLFFLFILQQNEKHSSFVLILRTEAPEETRMNWRRHGNVHKKRSKKQN